MQSWTSAELSIVIMVLLQMVDEPCGEVQLSHIICGAGVFMEYFLECVCLYC